MTPKQEAALARGTKIRTICGIYSQAGFHNIFTRDELLQIREACDTALLRIRGETETAKRQRERAEVLR